MLTMKRAAIIITLVLLAAVPRATSAQEIRLSLRDCIATALTNQPAIKAAREGVNAGQDRVTQARAPYLPQIKATTGYSESRSLGGALGDTISKSYATSLSLNQILYDFGKTGNSLEAVRLGSLSAERDADRINQEVILNVKQAYYGLLAARKLAAVSHKTLEQAESHQRQAEAFYHAGSKPKFDVTRSEVEVNSARLGLINANNSVRIRTIALYNAMGIDPGGVLDIDDVLAASSVIPLFEQAMEEAVRSRPEMIKSEEDLAAARARVKAEESGYYPTLSANGDYTWARGTSEMGMYRGDIQNSWNAGVSLSIPLFEGGLTKGKVGEARANVRALEAQGQTLRQAILMELSQAYADIDSATARISVMELSIKKARENLELAQGRYEAGIGPYIEVTDAQVASINAETDHVQALYDYQLAAARLIKAMGRVE